MTQIAEKIFSDAMQLDETERAELAVKLMDTLEASVDAGYDEAWLTEISERERELETGEVQAIPWEEAKKMMFGDGKAFS